jgi:hypothetical protein
VGVGSGTGGSGWVVLVSFNAAGQGGSNGGSGNVGVAVLAELRYIQCEVMKKMKIEKKEQVWVGSWAVAQRVAVVGWQWYQSKEGVRAVRMVVVGGWQWQY